MLNQGVVSWTCDPVLALEQRFKGERRERERERDSYLQVELYRQIIHGELALEWTQPQTQTTGRR